MKSFLPLLSFLIIFSSCSTAYKTGQTPDDVYFSPERAIETREEYTRVEERNENRYRYNEESADDRYLRMKVRNRYRWNYVDEDYYSYNPYVYKNANNNWYYNPYYWNNYYNSCSYWNYYYNPYATNVIVVNSKAPVYNKPRTTNLHVFDDPKTPSNTSKVPYSKTRTYDNSSNKNTNSSRGSVLRDLFGTSGNSSSGSTNSKTYPSGSSSSSGSSSGNSSSTNNSGGSRGNATRGKN